MLGVQEEGIEILSQLGLTYCQARVYLSLINSGTTTVKTLSKTSKMAREQVYQTLPKILDLGLVVKIVDRPSKFKAIPIQECISMLMQRRTNRTCELETKTNELVNNFKETWQPLSSSDSKFILIPKKARVLKRIINFITTARTELKVVTLWSRASYAFFTYHDLFRKALDNGTTIRFIVGNVPDILEKNLDHLDDLRNSPNFEVRFLKTPVKCIVAIKDKSEALLIIAASPELNGSSALCSTNFAFIELVRNYFDNMWAKSLELTPELMM